jgi:hypothetical protein
MLISFVELPVEGYACKLSVAFAGNKMTWLLQADAIAEFGLGS